MSASVNTLPVLVLNGRVFSAIWVLPSREQVVEGGTKRHCVDHQESILGEDEDDHFEKVACEIWPDGQLLGRIAVGVEVHDDQGVIGSVTDVLLTDPVSPR